MPSLRLTLKKKQQKLRWKHSANRNRDKKGELVLVDRRTEVAVDLAENMAAKFALQKAGLRLAERLVTQLAAE